MLEGRRSRIEAKKASCCARSSARLDGEGGGKVMEMACGVEMWEVGMVPVEALIESW